MPLRWGLRDGAALSSVPVLSAAAKRIRPVQVRQQDSQHVKGTRSAISSNQKAPKCREKQKGQVVGDKMSPAARHTGVSTVASQKGMEIKGQDINSTV